MISLRNHKWSKLLSAACFTFFSFTLSAQQVTSPNGCIVVEDKGTVLMVSYKGQQALQLEEVRLRGSSCWVQSANFL